MDKKFKFTNECIRTLPANPASASSTDLEVSDTEVIGLKCLSGKSGNKRFLLRYVFVGRKRSIALGTIPNNGAPGSVSTLLTLLCQAEEP